MSRKCECTYIPSDLPSHSFHQEEVDPMADFKKIFERFASAEQVTSAVPGEEDKDGDDQDDDKKDQARKTAEASGSDSGDEGEV